LKGLRLSMLKVQAMKEHGGLHGSVRQSVIPYVHGRMAVVVLMCVVLV
jgi:hypothetical protein